MDLQHIGRLSQSVFRWFITIYLHYKLAKRFVKENVGRFGLIYQLKENVYPKYRPLISQ